MQAPSFAFLALLIAVASSAAIPSGDFMLARTLEQPDQVNIDVEILRRLLVSRAGPSRKAEKAVKNLEEHAAKGMNLMAAKMSGEKLTKEQEKDLDRHVRESKKTIQKVVGAPATHGPGSSGSEEHSGGHSGYDGKVSKLPSDAPPHRNGKPSSGGDAGSSGRHR
ncbi:hypothetical protein OC842_003447 [Tilletia horrida]|uniref:Uncharacterized protein n=1 Tax=Tilletia horrida TaxID=155126 RepID=A0AAN6JR76_9BASI|nr:hypothetical protein OC842_003447 [Tilletia horrida]KAK0559868.1 hypothetical protein OC844_004110 [Tilletia horrida]